MSLISTTSFFEKYIFVFATILFATNNIAAQPTRGETIDGVVAVLGNKIILHSEIEFEFQQYKKEFGEKISDTLRCEILKQKLTERLLVSKAEVDSIPLNDERVDAELDQRIERFAQQFPSGMKGLEEFYGKPISEIKSNNREKIKDGILASEMQQKILKEVKITPTDIKKFFEDLSKDSLPYFSEEVELAQLIIEPKVSKESKEISKQKAVELRQRLLEGESFRSLARIYSDDKGSAREGGDLGFFGRGMMLPEFEAASFKTPQDSISKVVETKFGFHIIQVIKRRGEEVNARHILIRPQIYSSDIELAKNKIDSLLNLIKSDSMPFSEVAKKFSNDKATASRGGFITDGTVGISRIPVNELPKEVFLAIQPMKAGEISQPELVTMSLNGEPTRVWRIYFLKSEFPPHEMNIKTDYQKLQLMAESNKKNKTLQKWIDKNRKIFYAQVSDEYKTCPQLQSWITKK